MQRLVLVVLLAAWVVPSVIGDDDRAVPLLLKGRVYCDTCRVGYETPASRPIAGAIVKIECRTRSGGQVTFTKHGVTDSTGNYEVLVYGDRGTEICDAVLVKSPDARCNKTSEGRDRARVILTRNNGMNSNIRFANAMGFDRAEPLDICPKILELYNED